MNKKIFGLAALALVILIAPVYADTNVSILYGWNGTNYVPVQLTSEGAIKTDINMTQAVGLSPKVNNTYDLGNLAKLWANLYVRSIRSGSGPLSLFAGSNEVITILPSGYVGIGTTTPTSALTVIGDLNVTGNSFINNINITGLTTSQGTVNITENLFVTKNLTVGNNVLVLGIINATTFIGNAENLTGVAGTNTSLEYGYNGTNFVPLLTSPEGILRLNVDQLQANNASQLVAGANGTDLTLTGSLTAATATITGGLNVTNGGMTVANGNVGIGTTSPSAGLQINTSNPTLRTNGSVFIDGRVSIGTVNDTVKLTIGGTSVNAFQVLSTDDVTRAVLLNSDSTQGCMRAYGSGATNIQFCGQTTSWINTGSNFGINTVSPAAPFHVNGSTATGGTGGTITDIVVNNVSYRVHTFTSNGTFVPPTGVSAVEYLVVAGGGSGGNTAGGGGGGGAGGFRTGVGYNVIPGTSYTVTVGTGGPAIIDPATGSGNNGSSSVFGSITTVGGGAGNGVDQGGAGSTGGSGGGGAYGVGVGGSGTVGQGYSGGNGSTYAGAGAEAGGGGGGAGSAGLNGILGGNGGGGGNGTASSINGSLTYYAGGGGGGINVNAVGGGTGGTGGGGTGGKRATSNGVAGTNGLGGGGGGGGSSGFSSGAGGSGVVIVRYIAPAAIFQGSVSIGTVNASNMLTVSGNADITGSLGIGTTHPEALLQVGPASTVDGALVFLAKDDHPAIGKGSLGIWTATQAPNYQAVDEGYILSVGTRGGSTSGYKSAKFAGAVHMAVNQGNVGIGTTSPSDLLDVRTASTQNVGYELHYGSNLEWQAQTNTNGGWSTWNDGSGNVKVVISGITNDNSYFNTGGNVGIGTTSPDPARIRIKGSTTDNNAYAIYAEDSSAGLTFNVRNDGYGYLKASAWAYGSDRRLKENINYFTNGLDVINALHPVRFDYINGEKNQLGFIAQDVQGVIPRAVIVTDNSTGMLGLKTDFIIPYTVNAIQEQQTEIEQLKNENTQLKIQNTAILKRIASLEAKIK